MLSGNLFDGYCVTLYCIYDMTPYENFDKDDIPEEAWEYMKKFEVLNDADWEDFQEQLNYHYDQEEQFEILGDLLKYGYFYDYKNGFKYVWDKL